MRLLHVTDRVSARGGADVHLLGVLGELVARGHDVVLAAGRADDGIRAPCEVHGIDGLDSVVESIPSVVQALDRAALHADVIHVHNAIAPDVLRWAARRGAIATVQDHRSFCPGRGKLTLAGDPCTTPMSSAACASCFEDPAYGARIQRVTAERLDALRQMRTAIVLSEYMRRELHAVGVSRVEVIPPFVHDLDPNAAPSGPPCVLFVGRLVAAKGATDARAAHAESGIPLPLVYAGTGPLRRDLEQTHEVLGWVPRASLSSVYRRARAVIMPSRWQEPFGIAGLEALTLGIPVAAYQSGAIPEWHPGAPLLVPWGNIPSLARALTRAINTIVDADLTRFQPTPLTDNLEALYSQLRA